MAGGAGEAWVVGVELMSEDEVVSPPLAEHPAARNSTKAAKRASTRRPCGPPLTRVAAQDAAAVKRAAIRRLCDVDALPSTAERLGAAKRATIRRLCDGFGGGADFEEVKVKEFAWF